MGADSRRCAHQVRSDSVRSINCRRARRAASSASDAPALTLDQARENVRAAAAELIAAIRSLTTETRPVLNTSRRHRRADRRLRSRARAARLNPVLGSRVAAANDAEDQHAYEHHAHVGRAPRARRDVARGGVRAPLRDAGARRLLAHGCVASATRPPRSGSISRRRNRRRRSDRRPRWGSISPTPSRRCTSSASARPRRDDARKPVDDSVHGGDQHVADVARVCRSRRSPARRADAQISGSYNGTAASLTIRVNLGGTIGAGGTAGLARVHRSEQQLARQLLRKPERGRGHRHRQHRVSRCASPRARCRSGKTATTSISQADTNVSASAAFNATLGHGAAVRELRDRDGRIVHRQRHDDRRQRERQHQHGAGSHHGVERRRHGIAERRPDHAHDERELRGRRSSSPTTRPDSSPRRSSPARRRRPATSPTICRSSRRRRSSRPSRRDRSRSTASRSR